VAKAKVMASFSGFGQECLLSSIPLYSVFGLNGFLSTVAGGNEIHVRQKFDAASDYRSLRDLQCTLYNSVRTMMLRIFELDEFDPEGLVLRGGSMGANLTIDLAQMMTEKLGIDTYIGGYGATETC